MIVSASRRCDLPARYLDWLLGRLSAGYCLVRNPYDARSRRRVSLEPERIDCLVLWTRDLGPLLARLGELESRCPRFYVQLTLTGYPRALEPGVPDPPTAIRAAHEFAQRVSPERLVWRYDPILVADGLGPDFHLRSFERLAAGMEGAARRLVVSLADEYAGAAARLAAAGAGGAVFGSPKGRAAQAAPRGGPKGCGAGGSPTAGGARGDPDGGGAGGRPKAGGAPAAPPRPYGELLAGLSGMAAARGFERRACAEPYDLSAYGFERGACVDRDLIERLFGVELPAGCDAGQRPACGCAPSVDIGAYGACPARCAYCYANRGSGRLLEVGPEDECLEEARPTSS